ncbi:hypothetical protein A4X13_0g8554 [Tilletia indica]|uniref:Uncharacterized protein n=1 Tax=Tilletia indica TaxID=43049 RepID=A0A177T411_9BASI|nr:hypothetical protein A4X13_0g8554 [Tilletia indica]
MSASNTPVSFGKTFPGPPGLPAPPTVTSDVFGPEVPIVLIDPLATPRAGEKRTRTPSPPSEAAVVAAAGTAESSSKNAASPTKKRAIGLTTALRSSNPPAATFAAVVAAAAGSPAKAAATPTKKRSIVPRPKLGVQAQDLDKLDENGLRAICKMLLEEVAELKASNKKILGLLSKPAPAVVSEKQPDTVAEKHPDPTVEKGLPWQVPSRPARSPRRVGGGGGGAVEMSFAQKQKEAYEQIRPRSRPSVNAYQGALQAEPVADDLAVMTLKVHRGPTAMVRRSLQALFVPTRFIKDYGWLRENTLQIVVVKTALARLEDAFRAANIEVYEKYDPTQPGSPSAPAEAKTYAWERFVRVADSGIAHAREMGRPGVATFYEEWKARETARRAAEAPASTFAAADAVMSSSPAPTRSAVASTATSAEVAPSASSEGARDASLRL